MVRHKQIKMVISKGRRYYIVSNKYVSVDVFNNILSNWEFMGYTVKKYIISTAKCKVVVWYI